MVDKLFEELAAFVQKVKPTSDYTTKQKHLHMPNDLAVRLARYVDQEKKRGRRISQTKVIVQALREYLDDRDGGGQD